VAGAVTFEVSFGVKDDEVTDSRFECTTSRATTNRMKLAEAMLTRELATSSEVSFHVAGQKFFALSVPSHGTEEVAYNDVSIDTLYDLVVIENITRQALKPLAAFTRASTGHCCGAPVCSRKERSFRFGQAPCRSLPQQAWSPR